ncbi:MAG: transposase [Phycisphaerae bacterium]|nr:transposase [Phycisphaerae bacterium]
MRIAITKPLFAWDSLEDSPSLHTIKQLLASLPDGRLLQGLRDSRGRGRDDYPVSVLWGVVLLRILLRHVSFEAVLAELRRNAGLAALIGISSEKEVPKAWNISRFLEGLGREPPRSHLREMFAEMVRRLGQVVPDLGRHSVGDSTALHARGTHNAKTVAAGV